jgi:hypothetical protein
MPLQVDTPETRLAIARAIMARRLSETFKEWRVEGNDVLGPGTLAVRVVDQHQLGRQHVDVGFVLNRDDPKVPIIWDCAAGVGSTDEEILACAIDIWMRSTFPVILELLKHDGSAASHFNDGVRGCCPGWHVIHGPILAYGRGDAPKALQSWAVESSLLAKVGPVAAKGFDRKMLNGVKLLFGFGDGNVAEVRVNGVCDKDASECLAALGWPHSADAAFARLFFLFVHSTAGVVADPPNSGPRSAALL